MENTPFAVDFDTASRNAAAKIAADLLRVEAFFKDILDEAPAIAHELSVLVVTPDDNVFLMKARDDRRAAYNDVQTLRREKTGHVYDDRICVYVGPDNRYEKMGVSLETVLAHELGHWLDGAGHRDMKWPDSYQRAESIADVFAGLYHLRKTPHDKQHVATFMARVLASTNGNPRDRNYTIPAIGRLLATVDTLDLSGKTLVGLREIARDITHKTYRARGRAPTPAPK